MNRKDLFNSLKYLDDDLLLRSEEKVKWFDFSMILKPLSAVAAVLLLAVIVNNSGILRSKGALKPAPETDLYPAPSYLTNEEIITDGVIVDSSSSETLCTILSEDNDEYIEQTDVNRGFELMVQEETGMNYLCFNNDGQKYLIYNYYQDKNEAKEAIEEILSQILNGN